MEDNTPKVLSPEQETIKSLENKVESLQAEIERLNQKALLKDFVIKDNKVVKYIGKDSVVQIPDGVEAISNKGFLPKGAFEKCKFVKKIIIPDSVKIIDDWAFANCEGLETIIIPDSVISIGIWAFSDCYKLKELYISDSVKQIGENAFLDCNNLTITVPKGCKCGKNAFKGCKSVIER